MSWFEGKNEIRWTPSETLLPMETTWKGSWIGGPMAVFGALFFIGPVVFMALCVTVWDIQSNGIMLAFTLLFMLVFVAFGLLAIFFGLYLVLNKGATLISRTTVEYTGRGLFGPKHWVEPLSNYQGVVKKFTYDVEDSTVSYKIVLKHRDRNKNITLFHTSSADGEALRDHSWEQFGRVLGLPLFEETADGLTPAGPGSLQKLAAEYATRPYRTATIQLGKKAILERTVNGLRVTHAHYWGCWRGLLGMTMCLAFLGLAYCFSKGKANGQAGNIWIFWVVMTFFLLITFSLFITDLFTVEELFIQPGKVEYWRRYGRRIMTHKAIVLTHVKQVAVKKDPKNPALGPSLWLEDGHNKVQFGIQLSKDDKVALKEYILARSFNV